MMYAIGIFVYFGLALWVGRWIYRSDDDQKGTIRFKAAITFIAPLLILRWLQAKARGYLDIWYEK